MRFNKLEINPIILFDTDTNLSNQIFNKMRQLLLQSNHHGT